MTPADERKPDQDQDGQPRPDTADDGPVQTRRSEDAPDRQIAQERQQSTGQGMGQS